MKQSTLGNFEVFTSYSSQVWPTATNKKFHSASLLLTQWMYLSSGWTTCTYAYPSYKLAKCCYRAV